MEDALQVSHATFTAKMTEYSSQIRPVYAFTSMRQKRLKLIKDGPLHKKYINKAVKNMVKNSLAANKTTGRYVLKYIRDKILLHGYLFRNHNIRFRCDHIFTNVKRKSDIHPKSKYKRTWRKQKSHMKMIGSDIESQALILFLEQKLVDSNVILEEDKLPDDHHLLTLTEPCETALDELRMLKLS